AQARKAQDRRRVHYGARTPTSLAQAMGSGGESAASNAEVIDGLEHKVDPIRVVGEGPLVVREKSHPASPMTLDQALYEMELVGHDFYLFMDKESERPSVVYRRKGYDYGVISDRKS